MGSVGSRTARARGFLVLVLVLLVLGAAGDPVGSYQQARPSESSDPDLQGEASGAADQQAAIPATKPQLPVFTQEELATYNGGPEAPGGKVYVAYLGDVYDVTEGKDKYGPGGGYHFFAGRDGARAYATGEFNEQGLVPEVLDLSPIQMHDIMDWQKFFRYHAKYKKVGKLQGLYYDENGKATEAKKKVLAAFKEAKEFRRSQIDELEDKRKHPTCNIKSTRQELLIWCDGDFVPREVTKPVPRSEPRKTCHCFKLEDTINSAYNLSVYKGCGEKQSTCKLDPVIK